MKKLLISAAGALVCTGVFAAVEAANTLCRIQIDSSRQETLLSIPLKTVGGAENTIDITKYVLTQGLKAGDKLMKRTNGKWESWTLDADNGQWVAGKTVSDADLTTADATLAVGDVIALYRANPSGSFYLYGELPADFPKTQTASARVWTMMGNPKPVETTLAAIPKGTGTSGVQNGDKIIVSGGNTYYYNSTEKRWEREDLKNPTTTEVTFGGITSQTVTYPRINASTEKIPAGEGFWYIRASGAEALSVTWPAE